MGFCAKKGSTGLRFKTSSIKANKARFAMGRGGLSKIASATFTMCEWNDTSNSTHEIRPSKSFWAKVTCSSNFSRKTNNLAWYQFRSLRLDRSVSLGGADILEMLSEKEKGKDKGKWKNGKKKR